MAGPSTGVGGGGTDPVSVGVGGSGDGVSRVGMRISIAVGEANMAVESWCTVGVVVRRGEMDATVVRVGLADGAVEVVPDRLQAAINARAIQATIGLNKWHDFFINSSYPR